METNRHDLIIQNLRAQINDYAGRLASVGADYVLAKQEAEEAKQELSDLKDYIKEQDEELKKLREQINGNSEEKEVE
ncbi:hypothetical protein CHH91_04645 [Virgibacillus sp. 7505]|uniref:hypothetical protein n=1 Tax=Virgibacillus sp. 7505 TaxID=2022548 RepID=UPI000BA5FCB1|nr:hypothetical protein [Virgibacillus sp. 7505]PAE17298.1 hypothetical protein CHH91_04645 [Virgibacillus sp. 7505]